MIRVRATKKLLDRLKLPEREISDQLLSPLGDWYAMVVFTRPQIALLVNETTLLPWLVTFAPAASFVSRLPAAFASALESHGISGPFVDAVTQGSASVILDRTASRSILGAMNDHVQLMRRFDFDASKSSELAKMSHRLAESPTKALLDRNGSPEREIRAFAKDWSSREG